MLYWKARPIGFATRKRHERTEARRDTRAGHYERNLETKAGEVTLKAEASAPDV